MINTPKAIVIHCTDTPYSKAKDQFNAVNAYHRDERSFPKSVLGWNVGYQRLITGGKNYKAREDYEEGMHTSQIVDGVSMNLQSLGVCVGFDGDVEYMPAEEYRLLKEQVSIWQKQYGIPNEKVYFHRKFNTAKTCPGSLITDAWLELLLAPAVPEDKPISQCQKQDAIIQKQEQLIGLYARFVQFIQEFMKSS